MAALTFGGNIFTAHRVFNGMMPAKNPAAVSCILPFTSTYTVLNVDLSIARENDIIEFVQGMYVDNSQNSQALTIICSVTGMNIAVPAGRQGFFPVLSPNEPKFIISTTGAVSVPVQFLNFPVPLEFWDTGFNAISGDTTIATGMVAQTLFGGSAPIFGWAVYNPDPSNDLWVSDSTTAAPNGAGSIRVQSNGGGYETPPNYKPIGPVSIYGAITGQKITARRW